MENLGVKNLDATHEPGGLVEQAQYLTFQLAGEEYAINILQVREILEYDTVTQVPSTPAWVRGVMNLRGTVVPVVDLAAKFGLPASPVTRQSCIVIVEVVLDQEQTVMGVVADTVSQVIELAPDQIEDPPTFGGNVRVGYLLGMGKIGNKFALILDIDKILAAEELITVASLPDLIAEAESETEKPAAAGRPARSRPRKAKAATRKRPARGPAKKKNVAKKTTEDQEPR